jgi:hypothetical protein
MQTWNVRDWRREQLRTTWVTWITQNWQRLAPGVKIEAPHWFGAPVEAGFEPIGIAHPVGQARDWGMSFTDGSRIHIHEFANGRRVVHRDKHDPRRGLGHAVAHLMQETPYGILGIGVATLFLLANASDG